MDMIRHAIDGDRSATEIAHNSTEERIKALFDLIGDQRLAMLRAENGVIEVLRVRTRHGRNHNTGGVSSALPGGGVYLKTSGD